MRACARVPVRARRAAADPRACGLEPRANVRLGRAAMQLSPEVDDELPDLGRKRARVLGRARPLLLARLARDGHLAKAYAHDEAAGRAAVREAIKLNEKARRVSWASGGAQDAVVCGLVRTAVRKRYPGYALAAALAQRRSYLVSLDVDTEGSLPSPVTSSC